MRVFRLDKNRRYPSGKCDRGGATGIAAPSRERPSTLRGSDLAPALTFFLRVERRRTAPTPPADCRFIVSPLAPSNASTCQQFQSTFSMPPSEAPGHPRLEITLDRVHRRQLDDHRQTQNAGLTPPAHLLSRWMPRVYPTAQTWVLMICSRIEARETAGNRDILHAAAD